MKRYLTIIVLVMSLVLLFLTTAIAESNAFSEGLEYSLNRAEKSYSVLGMGSCSDTALIIPAEHNGLPVTRIYKNAFFECTSLKSVSLPNTITEICEYAFNGCLNLSSITIPESVSTIGNGAFGWCSSLDSVVFDDGILSIGDYAFLHCKFEEIIIPESVEHIGFGAFADCTKLTSITLPMVIGHIGYLFEAKYPSDNNERVPETLKTINIIGDNDVPHDAFYQCSNITSVTISGGVSYIRTNAFYNCENLEKVTIAGLITHIGNGSFMACNNLSSVTFGETVTTIEARAFERTNISCLNIPSSVTTIGDWAFRECPQLTNVVVPNGLASIGSKAFFDCTSLKNVYYVGTDTEWSAIVKGDDWDFNTGQYTISFTTVDKANAHTPKAPIEENRIAPACDEAGGYDMVVYCETCNSEIRRTHYVIAANGHTFDSKPSEYLGQSATCTEAAKYFVQCDNCNEITREKMVYVGKANGHDYDKTFFTWEDDLTAASAAMVCSDCDHGVLSGSCKLEWTSDVGKLTVTAMVTLNGQEYRDEKAITTTVSHGNIIVYLPTTMPDVTIFGAGYGSNCAMVICRTALADKTVIELPASGETIKLFFLEKDTYAPILPYMVVK